MTITKSKEMTIDEKQIDSTEQTSRKPDGKLFFTLIFSSYTHLIFEFMNTKPIDRFSCQKISISNRYRTDF